MRAGYKMTEVGEIPEDWEVHRCEDLSIRIMVGVVIRPTQYYVEVGVPALRSANIRENKITDSDLVFFSHEANELLSKSQTKTGDVLTVRTGYPGTSAVVLAHHAGCNCIDILITRPGYALSPYFLSIWTNSKFGKDQILKKQGGLAQKHFNLGDMKELLVALPPTKAEQEAIAEALGDADAWIESLEKLINKKCLIKQGAMQQLLSGKHRLPGFEGEWEEKRLGDHLTFLRNGVHTRADFDSSEVVRCLHYGDIHGSSSVFISPDNLPGLPKEKSRGLSRLTDGDVVFADASEDKEGVGKSVEVENTVNAEFVPGQHTIAVRFDKKVLVDGFKAYLQFIPDFYTPLRSLAAGTKVYATNRKHIAGIELRIPSVAEQTAIAKILSDMDAEIEALEAKLSKVRRIKEGMMSELLTGKTRLVGLSKKTLRYETPQPEMQMVAEHE